MFKKIFDGYIDAQLSRWIVGCRSKWSAPDLDWLFPDLRPVATQDRTSLTNKKPSRRWARVCGVGVAEITAARCECGRPIEPGDLELISEHQLRAVCAACHRDLFQITRTWWETSRNE